MCDKIKSKADKIKDVVRAVIAKIKFKKSKGV